MRRVTGAGAHFPPGTSEVCYCANYDLPTDFGTTACDTPGEFTVEAGLLTVTGADGTTDKDRVQQLRLKFDMEHCNV